LKPTVIFATQGRPSATRLASLGCHDKGAGYARFGPSSAAAIVEEVEVVDTTTLVVIILLILLLGGGGYWGYSSRSYRGPSLLTLIAIVLIVLLLTGRL